jgi:cytochrome c-type biogenesis protein CcsB
MMHVSLMMLSYATLIVGSLLSIFYIVFEFFLKKKQNSSIQISTNFKELLQVEQKKYLLQIFDIWSYRIIGFGFPLLTIGIISGAVWANEAWGSYWSWDPKETWAFITWLTFAIYLHVRLIKGWQGTKAAFLGSCGFFILWICYLGVNFLGQGLHSYGWVLN